MNPYIHPQSLVESENIGIGTRVWAFAHVLEGAIVGESCNIGDHAFVEGGAIIGDNVTIKNHVCVWDGVSISDDVFVGPAVTFTNDKFPRSPRMDDAQERYSKRENWLVETHVHRGASIGANATIIAGVELGPYCMIAAGSVVTTNAPAHALMMGAPARVVGYVCRCGQHMEKGQTNCERCATESAAVIS